MFCYVLGKAAVNDAFYSKFKLKFSSLFRPLLNGSCSLVDKNRWYCISRSYWVENLQLPFCFSVKRTHEFKWYTKTLWPNGKKKIGWQIPGPHKHLIWYILISHKTCFFRKCGLSDDSFVDHANLTAVQIIWIWKWKQNV